MKRQIDGREDELVSLACKGDLKAFEELVCIHMKWAYYLAYRLSNDHYLADEISQEAFVALYRNINRFRRQASLRTYLYRIIVNSWRQHLRGVYRKERLNYALSRRVRSERDMFDEIKADETRGKINSAVAELPVRQRDVFILKHMQGLKISEVALMMGCPEGTVKANLFKAVNNLRNKLK